MSTRSNIWYKENSGENNGLYIGVYVYSDGYVDGVGAVLHTHFNSYEDAKKIVSLGHISAMDTNIDDIVSYHRMRDEDITCYETYDIEELLNDELYMEEYCYLHNGEEWLVSDHGRDFVPLKSFFNTNEVVNDVSISTSTLFGGALVKIEDSEEINRFMFDTFGVHAMTLEAMTYAYATKYIEGYTNG